MLSGSTSKSKEMTSQNQTNQNNNPLENALSIKKKYEALGYYEIGSSGMTIEKERLEKMKEARILNKNYENQKERLGIKNVKLQQYQRKQVPINYIPKMYKEGSNYSNNSNKK